MIGKFFAPLAMKVAGGIVAALLAIVVWQTLRANSWETAAVRWEGKFNTEQASRSISLASIEGLRLALDAKNVESIARAQAAQDARAEAARTREQLATVYRTTDARIRALMASVGRNEPGDCSVPEEVDNALNGL